MLKNIVYICKSHHVEEMRILSWIVALSSPSSLRNHWIPPEFGGRESIAVIVKRFKSYVYPNLCKTPLDDCLR